MSDFLGRLAARTLGLAPVVAPRLPSLFEPPAGPVALPAALTERPALGLEEEEHDAVPEPRPTPPRRPDTARGQREPAGEAPARTVPLRSAGRREREPTPDAAAAPRTAPPVPVSARVVPGAVEGPRGRVAPPSPARASRSAREGSLDGRATAGPEVRAPLGSATVGPVAAGLAPVPRAAREEPAKPARAAAASVPAQPPAPGSSLPSPLGSLAPSRLPHFPQLAALTTAGRRSEPPPRVEVTIGRIEVRATSTASAAPARRAAASSVPSLDDYLRRRDGRQR